MKYTYNKLYDFMSRLHEGETLKRKITMKEQRSKYDIELGVKTKKKEGK